MCPRVWPAVGPAMPSAAAAGALDLPRLASAQGTPARRNANRGSGLLERSSGKLRIVTTPNPTSDEPSGPKPRRDILSLAEPAPPAAPSRFERLAAQVASAGRKAVTEGRRLAGLIAARARPAWAGAARLAQIAAGRTAAALGPLREPVIRAAKHTGTGVRHILSRIRLRHALIVTGSFAVLLVLVVGYSIATLPLDGGLQVDPTPKRPRCRGRQRRDLRHP